MWRIFNDCVSSKLLVLMDCLMDAIADLAGDLVLRCIMDQAMGTPDLPHPVQLVIIALPAVFESANESLQLSRVAQSFWRVVRVMLFSQLQQPQGQMEHLMLRSCLRSATDIPEEDTFLAAKIPDGASLTVAFIRSLVTHGIVHKAMDLLWWLGPKNFVRFPSWTDLGLPPLHMRLPVVCLCLAIFATNVIGQQMVVAFAGLRL